MGEAERKLYVLDTNILLHEPFAIYSFHEHDVVIPMTVLEELDRIKDSKRDISKDARIAIRALEDIFTEATPEQITEGIMIGKEGVHSCASILPDFEIKETVQAFADKAGDNRILNAALYLQSKHQARTVVLVTKDINMRLRAKGAGMRCVEDYRTDQLIDDVKLLPKGFQRFKGSFWDQIGQVDSMNQGRSTFHKVQNSLPEETYVNQYLLDESEEFAARVLSIDPEHIELKEIGQDRLMHRQAWGVRPKISTKVWRWTPCSTRKLIW